jgi:hypothetical protein
MKITDKLKEMEPVLRSHDVDKFKSSVSELYALAKTDREKEIISEFIKSVMTEKTEQSEEDFRLLLIKARLLEVEDILPYSYIARNYFKKSKAWLFQRLRGYSVNGKPARFTHDELETLGLALQDISKKIGSITVL